MLGFLCSYRHQSFIDSSDNIRVSLGQCLMSNVWRKMCKIMYWTFLIRVLWFGFLWMHANSPKIFFFDTYCMFQRNKPKWLTNNTLLINSCNAFHSAQPDGGAAGPKFVGGWYIGTPGADLGLRYRTSVIRFRQTQEAEAFLVIKNWWINVSYKTKRKTIVLSPTSSNCLGSIWID